MWIHPGRLAETDDMAEMRRLPLHLQGGDDQQPGDAGTEFRFELFPGRAGMMTMMITIQTVIPEMISIRTFKLHFAKAIKFPFVSMNHTGQSNSTQPVFSFLCTIKNNASSVGDP